MGTSRFRWPTLKQVPRRQQLMNRRRVELTCLRPFAWMVAFSEGRAKCRYCLHSVAC